MSGPAFIASLPPRLSMDDYAGWVSQPCSADRLKLAERQKRIEEQILVRFRLPAPPSPPPRPCVRQHK
jgi:hypothetical protein